MRRAFSACGYVDRETEVTQIAFQYEAAQPFRDGLAAVRINGRWGYIDRGGKLVIQPSWTKAAPFYGGYAEVHVNDVAGVIDRRGRIVVRPQFKRIVPLAKGVFIAAPVKPTAWSGGHLGPDTDPMSLGGFGSAGLYHLKRGWITEPDLQFSTFDDPRRGLVWAGRRNEDGEELWGLMRVDGTWQLTPRYSYVQKLHENRAIVRSVPDKTLRYPERARSVLSGAVDEKGRLVVPIQFGWLGYWRGGYGLATRTGGAAGLSDPSDEPNAGIVSGDGALLASRYFDEVDISEDGSLPRARVGRVWNSVSPRGELLPDQKDGTLQLACPDGRTFVRRGGQVEVHVRGKSVGLYKAGYFFPRDCSRSFSLQRDDRWFILTPEGRILGDEQGFENSYGFDGETTAVKRGGKWGIIDRQGRFTVPPRFANLRPFGPRVYQVGEGDDAEWIDATGHPVPKPVRPRPDPANALLCEGGLTRFQANGRWGLKDGAGNTVIRPEYRVLTCFSHGFAWAASPQGREWCPIGPNGERRQAFLCRTEIYPYAVTHHAPERLAEDPFESSVLWNLALLEHLSGARPVAPRWIPDGRGRASHSVMNGLPQPELADAARGPAPSMAAWP